MKTSRRLYNSAQWKDLRLRAIQHVGAKCEKCTRHQDDGAVLQVHHRRYVRGRRPWDYPFEELTVLCRRCHAEEHKILMEHCNWVYESENVREEQDGICDFCGTEIRIEHFISHKHWGDLTVGTGCSDFLTDTKEATEAKKFTSRRANFCDDKKWTQVSHDKWFFERRGLRIEIVQHEPNQFTANVNGVVGRKMYVSAKDAKYKLFELLNSGKLENFIPRTKSKKAKPISTAHKAKISG